MNCLMILVGFPGSGKTTYAKTIANRYNNIVHHSSDAIRKELYGDEAEQQDPGKVFDIMKCRRPSGGTDFR